MSEKSYLSEEELARLIEETEQSGMLKAPSYLKREILELAAQKEVTGGSAEWTAGEKEMKPETGIKKNIGVCGRKHDTGAEEKVIPALPDEGLGSSRGCNFRIIFDPGRRKSSTEGTGCRQRAGHYDRHP